MPEATPSLDYIPFTLKQNKKMTTTEFISEFLSLSMSTGVSEREDIGECNC